MSYHAPSGEQRDDKSLVDLDNLIEAAKQRIHDEQQQLLRLVEQRGRLTILLELRASSGKPL